MKDFTVHQGLVAPMDRENVDTDAIIPKQFLKSIRKTGFGQNLFDEWRYLDAGFPGQDPASRKPNPDFVLNQSRYAGASILLARKNFGCGSSREHAPWALDQFGFRAIIAPSYADIFFNNSFKNGLLPIVLPDAQVDQLFSEALAFPGYTLTIDLERQVVVKPQGEELPFEVQGFRKYCLLNGFDDIGLTLRHADKIKNFEAERLAQKALAGAQHGELKAMRDASFAQLPAPPYYAVIFSSRRTPGDEGYGAMGERMATLAQQQPGFLGIESARDADGFGITVSYWTDEASIRAWKHHAEHRIAQETGMQSWYQHYETRVAKVERAYSLK